MLSFIFTLLQFSLFQDFLAKFSQFSWSLYHHTARKYNQHSCFTSFCLGVSVIFNVFHQYIHAARAAFTCPWLYSFQLMLIDFLCLSHPSFIALHVFFWCWLCCGTAVLGVEPKEATLCVWDKVQCCLEQLWFCTAINQCLFWGYWCSFCLNIWDVLMFFVKLILFYQAGSLYQELSWLLFLSSCLSSNAAVLWEGASQI